MGIFDRLKKEDEQKSSSLKKPEAFEPFVIDTQDVSRELISVATANKINPKLVDFKIIKISTSYRLEGEDDPHEVDAKQLGIFDDDNFFINPDMKIEQHFKVEIFDTRSKEDNIALPGLSLGANKNLTKVVVTVKKSLNIRYSSGFEVKLKEEINKRKVRSKVLVGIREATMEREIKKIAALARVNNIIENDTTFVVMTGIEPLLPINDAFVEHYKKKINPEDSSGRVDYSRRGYLQAVGEGEVVLEYIKPQEGAAGKTCRGVYLPVNEPKITHDNAINITENIIKKEDDKTIQYIAKRSGYVKDEGGVYDIQEEMEISEVNFKTTGSIEAGLDRNIKINIKESDALTDAIGTGMSVESTELNVDGNVGSQANIRAKLVKIGGQTHKTSSIWADTINISVHRGLADGKEVTIDRLEGGKVIADVARVKHMIGGEVIARQIYIEELFSNAHIITTELIEITKLKGSNNKFLVDPASSNTFKDDTSSLKKRIEETKKALEQLPRQLENKKNLIDKNKQSVEMIKEKIAELKDEGKRPPVTFMGKLKEYQQLVNEYNTLLKSIKDSKFQLNDLKEELDQLQYKIFDAKVINHSSWLEYNEIKFRLISPELEIVHNTKDHEISKVITLVQTTDDVFRINRSSEYVE